MARMLLLISVGMLLLVGCQQAPVVERPPMPNLDGPQVLPPEQPVATAPIPSTSPTPSPKPRIAEIPREWLPQAPIRHWRWIVIHHSATAFGSAEQFDRAHRQKGWDELGYHFVIGNGAGSGDGQIEPGPRWSKQKWGAHTKTPDNQFNDFGVGICLVGDFDVQRPTPAQIQSLTRLVAYLMKTYRIPADHVIGHGDAKPTHCPGLHLHVADIRQRATILAQTPYALNGR